MYIAISLILKPVLYEKLLLFMGGVALLWMSSCAGKFELAEPAIPATQAVSTQRDADVILVEYLELQDGDRYVLNISEAEALNLGVAKEFYEMALQCIIDVNEEIQVAKRRAEQDPNFELIILSPEECASGQSELGVQTRMSPDPDPYNPIRGSLNTTGSGRSVEKTFMGPMWLTGVRFFCLLNSGITSYIKCSTLANSVLKEKQIMGTVFMNKIMEIDVAMTNISVKVASITGCPDGARVAYEGIGSYQ